MSFVNLLIDEGIGPDKLLFIRSLRCVCISRAGRSNAMHDTQCLKCRQVVKFRNYSRQLIVVQVSVKSNARGEKEPSTKCDTQGIEHRQLTNELRYRSRQFVLVQGTRGAR
jgi:hypothetical protein